MRRTGILDGPTVSTTIQTALPAWAPKIDPTRWVDNRVYTDVRVYEREVERIFNRTWLFAAHASELREPGDYITTTLLGQPLLLARGNDGSVRAFYNTCRHRGSKIALDACGHAAVLRCPYHFWSYDLDGSLIGIPGEEAYAGSGFVKEENPLAQIRCEEELGLVFVTFGTDAPSLRTYLGPMICRTLATPLANAEFEVVKYVSYELPVNWKVFAENARDGYHVPFVHPFFRKASPPGTVLTYTITGMPCSELGMDPKPASSRSSGEKIAAVHAAGRRDGRRLTSSRCFPMRRSRCVRTSSRSIRRSSLGPASVLMESRVLGRGGRFGKTVREIRALGHATWFFEPDRIRRRADLRRATARRCGRWAFTTA